MGLRFLLRRNHLFAVTLSGVLATGMLLTGCGGKKAEKPAEGNSQAQAATLAPVEVSTAQAEARPMSAVVQVTGSLAAEESSDLATQIAGQVVATPVDVGAFVGQGAVIARLDDRDAQLRLQAALAAEQQATSALRQAEVRLGLRPGEKFNAEEVPEVRSARRQSEAAEAQAKLAEAAARRDARLFQSGDISRSAHDISQTQAVSYRAQADAARQQYETVLNTARQSNQGIATAQAALEATRAQVGLARKTVADTVIKAPFAGYINDRPVAVGESVSTSTKIATLLRINPIKLRLQLPETETGNVRLGMTVTARVSAFADRQFEGKVTALTPALEQNSRTLTVEVSLNNAQNLLRPGMFATAQIFRPAAGAGVFVPRTAVFADKNLNASLVYLIEGEKARARAVQTGEQQGDLVQIVSGVKANDTVITSRLEQLFDGAQIKRR